jgi:hypothetical protein
MALRPSVMTLASLENDRIRLRTESNFGFRREAVAPARSVSDVWPDWSTQVVEAEPENAVERNGLSVVLWETAGAIVISIGMAVIVMVILGVLQSNVGRWSSESRQNAVASHPKPQGIAARQYAGARSKTRICALIDFRPVGDIPQNAWCVL